MLRNARGQSTAEYALVAAVVIGALLAMQIYVKRGAMGRLKGAADQMGEQFTPGATTSNFATSTSVTRREVTETGGRSTSTITRPETQSRTGEEHVEDKLDDELLF